MNVAVLKLSREKLMVLCFLTKQVVMEFQNVMLTCILSALLRSLVLNQEDYTGFKWCLKQGRYGQRNESER